MAETRSTVLKLNVHRIYGEIKQTITRETNDMDEKVEQKICPAKWNITLQNSCIQRQFQNKSIFCFKNKVGIC